MADTPTRTFQPMSDHERLLLLDKDVINMQKELTAGTIMMTAMSTQQTEQALVLERINAKSSLSVWVLGVIAIAVIGVIVSTIATQGQPQQPIEIKLVYPDK